jgi:hypothetical protein
MKQEPLINIGGKDKLYKTQTRINEDIEKAKSDIKKNTEGYQKGKYKEIGEDVKRAALNLSKKLIGDNSPKKDSRGYSGRG